MSTAPEAVTRQLLAAQRQIQALEQRLNALAAENADLKADLYRLQQNRPPVTAAGLDAMWKGTV